MAELALLLMPLGVKSMHEIQTEAYSTCSVAGVYPVGSCRGLFRAEVWHQDQPGVQRMRSKAIRRMPVINEDGGLGAS